MAAMTAWIGVALATLGGWALWGWAWRRARGRLDDVDAAWRQIDALLTHRRGVARALDPSLHDACDASATARGAGPAAVAVAEAGIDAALATMPLDPRVTDDLTDVADRLASTVRVHRACVGHYQSARRRIPLARWLGLAARTPWPSDR